MTAQLIQHGNREPLPDVAYKWKGQNGDEELQSRPFCGQLWERVAERSEQTYRYVWHGGMPPGPRVCEPKGAWILGRHVCPRRESHGIIRAGERIK